MTGDIHWRGGLITDGTPRLIPAACSYPLPQISPAVLFRGVSYQPIVFNVTLIDIRATLLSRSQTRICLSWGISYHHINLATSALTTWRHRSARNLLHLPIKEVSWASGSQVQYGIAAFWQINISLRQVSEWKPTWFFFSGCFCCGEKATLQ